MSYPRYVIAKTIQNCSASRGVIQCGALYAITESVITEFYCIVTFQIKKTHCGVTIMITTMIEDQGLSLSA